jgi:hypothetical protein
MAFRGSTPADIDSPQSQLSNDAPTSSLPNAFGMLIGSGSVPPDDSTRDRCSRPVPTYNDYYNPYKPPPINLLDTYSPYVAGEPLYDNRHVILARVPRRHTVSGGFKKPLTSWVWKLGHAFQTSPDNKRVIS